MKNIELRRRFVRLSGKTFTAQTRESAGARRAAVALARALASLPISGAEDVVYRRRLRISPNVITPRTTQVGRLADLCHGAVTATTDEAPWDRILVVAAAKASTVTELAGIASLPLLTVSESATSEGQAQPPAAGAPASAPASAATFASTPETPAATLASTPASSAPASTAQSTALPTLVPMAEAAHAEDAAASARPALLDSPEAAGPPLAYAPCVASGANDVGKPSLLAARRAPPAAAAARAAESAADDDGATAELEALRGRLAAAEARAATADGALAAAEARADAAEAARRKARPRRTAPFEVPEPDQARPPASFNEGDRVECFFRDWEKYFPATVRRVNDDLTYDVDYDDGYAEENLSAKLLKSPTRLRSKRARKARFT